MTKVVIALIVLAGCGGLFLLSRNGVKTAYVNGLPAYNQLPNQEFIFQQDCYIFKLEDRSTAYPLVGSQNQVPLLPAEVSAAQLEAEHPGVRLLDIVRVGDRFRILSVRRDESRTGVTVTFEILLNNPDERPYPRLDAFYLLDQTPVARGEAPTMRPEFAARRIKG